MSWGKFNSFITWVTLARVMPSCRAISACRMPCSSISCRHSRAFRMAIVAEDGPVMVSPSSGLGGT